jgi:hypothetical protein
MRTGECEPVSKATALIYQASPSPSHSFDIRGIPQQY